MPEKHLTVAGWKQAKKKAHEDAGFKKSATGIGKKVGSVEKMLKDKQFKKSATRAQSTA